MSAMMASGHQHHSIQQSDLDVLNALTMMPSTRSVTGHGNGSSSSSSHNDAIATAYTGSHKRRPLDTLQALRRPPIDPIVLAATLSSGPHVTRHHFLHSFGPKVESKQMTRSERARFSSNDDGKTETTQSRIKTRARAGSYANCDAEDGRSTLQEVQDIISAIEEEEGASQSTKPQYPSRQAPRSERLRMEQEAKENAQQRSTKDASKPQSQSQPQAQAQNQHTIPSVPSAHKLDERPEMARMPSAQLDEELTQRKQFLSKRQQKVVQQPSPAVQSTNQTYAHATDVVPSTTSFSSIVRPPPLTVRCYARTRIPTPHGEIFCHLYRNNRDQKEHLALVVDPAQNPANGQIDDQNYSTLIRSRTLDEVWGPSETEMERIVRGAYVGRLGPAYQEASKPQAQLSLQQQQQHEPTKSPLVRIHSECYTGETIGSQRCDCGEQLDEAIRLIHSDALPAKGVVVYLRQEGRGIGLLDKLMAYNLQDMGHDTVAANILLGHLADARKYDIAAEILRDLGVGSCRLLTNNPEKMEALEAEGISVTKRVPMVPRIWRIHSHGRTSRRRKVQQRRKGKPAKKVPMDASIVSQIGSDGATMTHVGPGSSMHAAATTDDEVEYDDSDNEDDYNSDDSHDSYLEHIQRRSGATMVGASITRGPELEKYLRTKVERMGHLLELPQDHQAQEHEHGQGQGQGQAQGQGEVSYTASATGSDLDAPLTDEEPLMNERDLQRIAGLDQNEDSAAVAEVDDDDDEQILVSSQPQ